MINCFIKSDFKCSGGILSGDPAVASIWRCSSLHWTQSAVTSSTCGNVPRCPAVPEITRTLGKTSRDPSGMPLLWSLQQPPHRTLDISSHLARSWRCCIPLSCTEWAKGRNEYMSRYEAARIWGSWMTCQWRGVVGVTGDSSCLEQTCHSVAEAVPILKSERAWKTQVTLSLTCDLHTFI